MDGFRAYTRYMHVGIQFAAVIGAMVALGYWADSRFGTGPLFILLGLALGFGIAFYNLYREVYGEKRGE